MKFSKIFPKLLKGLAKMLRNNLALKITAVIFAVILWSYVMAETNPPRPKTLENIPVKFQNMEDLKEKGLTVAENLSDVIKGVRVNLEVRQKELTLVNADNVSASIDFSGTNGKGEIKYKINVTTRYGSVTSKDPSTVTLTIDDYIKKQIPVECVVKGTPPEGFYIGEPSISPNVIEITGARSDVEKAASAICEVDVTNQSVGINQSIDVAILDRDGNPLDNMAYFETLPSVIVQIDILPVKTVPVNAIGSIINASKVKEGYEVGEINVVPAKIEIAAEKTLLNSISEVVLSDMDVSGASENMVFKVMPKAIEGVRFLNSNPIQVTVNIAQIQTEEEYRDIPVALLNRTSGSKVSIEPKTVDVTLFGGIKDMETIRRNDIKLFVDLSGLQKGTYSLPVRIESIKPVEPKNVSFSVSEIKVIIK